MFETVVSSSGSTSRDDTDCLDVVLTIFVIVSPLFENDTVAAGNSCALSRTASGPGSMEIDEPDTEYLPRVVSAV